VCNMTLDIFKANGLKAMKDLNCFSCLFIKIVYMVRFYIERKAYCIKYLDDMTIWSVVVNCACSVEPDASVMFLVLPLFQSMFVARTTRRIIIITVLSLSSSVVGVCDTYRGTSRNRLIKFRCPIIGPAFRRELLP
jgi:hypothetical protein